jgi:methylase of polypeptide subunit release factors
MSTEDEVAFGSLTVRYDGAGLRPRAWTQLQSRWAAALLADLPEGDVLELCAGVGHIGLLALVEAGEQGADRRGTADEPTRRLVQVDQDQTVCRLAERNAERAGLADRVDVRRGLGEDCLAPEELFALVLADPPWMPTDRVSDYPEDPPSAIDGGSDGLDVVRALLPVAERHLLRGGAVLLQVGGPDQVDAVRKLVAAEGSMLRIVDWRPAPRAHDGAVALLGRVVSGRAPARPDPRS